MRLITSAIIAALAYTATPVHAQEELDAPVLESPTTYTVLRNPEFKWKALEGATYYYLWINDGSGREPIKQWMTAQEANCSDGGTCYCTLSEWIAGETKWWVTAWMEPNVYSNWSDAGIFTSAITGTYPALDSLAPNAPNEPPPGE